MPRLYSNNLDWALFFPAQSYVQKIQSLVKEEHTLWNNLNIHLDIYEHSPTAPVIVYCHGLSSSGRMMANFALPLLAKGYNVICPDLPGFGLSDGPKGSFTLNELALALKHVVEWTHKKFQQGVYLTGISLGGILTYYATCLGAPVQSIACLNLLAMNDERNLSIVKYPFLVSCIKKCIHTLNKMLPHLTISLKHILNPDKLCSQPDIVQQFKTNPLVIKSYQLRALHSLLTQEPQIPFSAFETCPILVLHGQNDALIPEYLSKKNYEAIKGKKKYVTLPKGEHIPLNPSALSTYFSELTNWFK